MTDPSATPPGAGQQRPTLELRRDKPARATFLALPRRPIRVVLDGVTGAYNIGAIFRLCDAMLVERLVICGTELRPTQRKLVQSARGSQHWVPWEELAGAADAVRAARAAGYRVIAAEQTSTSVAPEALPPAFPVCLVLGSEMAGVSPGVLALADAAVELPMLGMSNSLNVATTAAILLHGLARACDAAGLTPTPV